MSENSENQQFKVEHTNSTKTIFSRGSNAKLTNQNGHAPSDAAPGETNFLPDLIPDYIRPHLQTLQPLTVLIVNWIEKQSSSSSPTLSQNELKEKLEEQPIRKTVRDKGKELYEEVRTKTGLGRLIEEFRTSDSSIQFLRKSVARLIAGESVQGVQIPDEATSKFVNDDETISLREYQHRVKNHLQQVISLIDLKRRKSNSNAGVILEQTIGLLQEFIQLNKNLDSRKNSKSSSMNMEARIRQNLQSLSSTFVSSSDETEFEVTVEPVNLSRNKIVPLGLIVNELSMNSFQHGFDPQEATRLSISLTADTDRAELRIQDNGSGLPEDFDWEDSYGLTLVKKLAEKQLQGSLEPTDNGGGTGWIVRFPLSDPVPSKNGK